MIDRGIWQNALTHIDRVWCTCSSSVGFNFVDFIYVFSYRLNLKMTNMNLLSALGEDVKMLKMLKMLKEFSVIHGFCSLW